MTSHDVDRREAADIDLATREGSSFDIALRGYARDQVEDRLAQWAAALAEAEYQRDEALRQLDAALAAPRTPVQEMNQRLQEILRLAEQEMHDELERARSEATLIVAQAREQVEADLDAAAAERSVAAGEARRLTDDAHAEAGRVLAVGRSEAEELTREAATTAQRLVADAREEVDRIMAVGRAKADELATMTAERREAVEIDHQRRLAECREEQATERAGLAAELADLQERRARVLADLARMRDALGAGLDPPTVLPDATG